MYPGHHHPASARRATVGRPGGMMAADPADENGLDDMDNTYSYSNATAVAPPMSAVKRMAAAGTPVPGTPSLHRGLFKKPGHLTAATPSKPQLASATPRHSNQTPGSVKPQPSAAKPTPGAGSGAAPARRLLFPPGATVPATPSGSRTHFASTPAAARHLHLQTPRVPSAAAAAKPTPVRATPAPRSMYAGTPSAAAKGVFKTPAPVVHRSAMDVVREVIASFHEPAPVEMGSEAVDRGAEIEDCPTRNHVDDDVDPNDLLFFPLDHFDIAPVPTFDFLPSPQFRPASGSSSDDDQPARPRRPLSPVITAEGVLPPPGPLTAVGIVDLDFDKTAESIEADTSSSCGSDFGDDAGMFDGTGGLMHEDESWVSGGGGGSSRRSKKTLDQVLDEMAASRPCPVLLFASDDED